MGLKKFYSFLNKNGLESSIKLEHRISSFKKEHPDEKPIVVFDFKEMISILVGATNNVNQIAESYCGGRERKILYLAEDWFKKLIGLDCKLVFWCGGLPKKIKFPLNRKNSITQRDINKIFEKDKFDGCKLKSIVKIVPIYFDGLIELAKIYGEVYFSLHNKCHQDIAYYATKNNALAVVKRDTDMIFFEGSWEIWTFHRINSMLISMINKKRIQKYLKLNNFQMTLFPALYQTVTEGKNYSCPFAFQKFHLIASFLSENIKETKYCNILNDSVIDPMISYLENNQLENISRDDLIKAIEFYSLEHINVANYQQFPWLEDHTMECGTALYEILNELDINMRLLFAQGVPELPVQLKNIKLRQVGLVRYSEWIKTNKKFYTTFHIFTKDYETFTEEPIYPAVPVPTISTILGYEKQKLSIDEKLQVAIWVIFGENTASDFVKDLKNTTFLVPKLVLSFLLKNNVITKNEANILAISLKISERNEHRHRELTSCPTVLHKRCIQLGYVYTSIIYSVSTSLKICGLSKYFKSGYYDGFIFHNIYNKFFNETENLKQLGDYSDIIF